MGAPPWRTCPLCTTAPPSLGGDSVLPSAKQVPPPSKSAGLLSSTLNEKTEPSVCSGSDVGASSAASAE